MSAPPKADADDYLGRFREIVSDPLNLLIERHPMAGVVEDGQVCLHNGNRVPLSGPASYYGKFSNILVINRGVHEPLEEFIFQQLIRRLPAAPRMLELGAYWGHYSMWLKRERPDAEVWLVEPEARNLEAGQANFESNGLSGQFIQAFVGTGQFEVDAFLRERGLDRIDVLHVDIQGYELEMLEGAAVTLGRRAADWVFISTHSQKLHRKTAARLKSFGYRLEVSSDFDAETTSCDGLLFASSPDAPALLGGMSTLGREDICLNGPRELARYLKRLQRLMDGATATP